MSPQATVKKSALDVGSASRCTCTDQPWPAKLPGNTAGALPRLERSPCSRLKGTRVGLGVLQRPALMNAVCRLFAGRPWRVNRTAVLPLTGSYWKSAVPVSLLFLPGWTTTVTPCGGVLVGEPFTVVPCGAAVDWCLPQWCR